MIVYNNMMYYIVLYCILVVLCVVYVLQRTYKGPPVDVWSCGIVLVAMLVGQLPWNRPSSECEEYKVWVQKQFQHCQPWKRLGAGVIS